MKNLRSVGGLLAISALLSCATAITDGTVPGPNTPPDGAGSDAGGSAGLGDPGGSPATGGSAPQTGGSSPGTGGKASGGTASGGMASGGKSSTGGSTGKGGMGSGGTGVGGSNAGGKAGTGSGGDVSVGGGTVGTAGGTSTGPCENPKDLPTASTGDTGAIGTTGPACYRTKSTFNTLVCSSFDGRTIKVNGTTAVCGMKTTFAPAIDGWNYFDISAGTYAYAQVGWFSS